MKLLYLRIRYFFELWGSDYYGEKIDFSFAVSLARVFADHHEELCSWQEV